MLGLRTSWQAAAVSQKHICALSMPHGLPLFPQVLNWAHDPWGLFHLLQQTAWVEAQSATHQLLGGPEHPADADSFAALKLRLDTFHDSEGKQR
jgi:hypothetical protein